MNWTTIIGQGMAYFIFITVGLLIGVCALFIALNIIMKIKKMIDK